MALRFLSRVALSLIFVGAGVMHVQNFAGTTAFAQAKLAASPLNAFVPITPEIAKLALALAVFLQLTGSALFIIGREKLGATMMLAFLVLITPVIHNPAGLTGAEAEANQVQLLKNIGLMGALGLVLTSRSGGKSKSD